MRRLALAFAAMLALAGDGHAVSRIKDITSVFGIRDNQLVGYGLVIGLAATGDSLRNAPFTEQSTRSMLQRMGVGVPPGSMKSRNIAAVVVTATLPPFIGRGARIDVTVSSLGDASSLSGGTLVMTPLMAADGKPYAVAQGPVNVTGFAAAGAAESLTQGVPTSGRIPNGALIEREISGDFNAAADLKFQIRNPDFRTATNIADVVNVYAQNHYGKPIAVALDLRTVSVARPETITATALMAALGDLPVETETPARIVIDEKTGTIVIGQDVKVMPVAVTHGSLTVRVTESPTVSQPNPFSNGQTAVEASTSIQTRQEGGPVAMLAGPSLEKLVSGLNQMGLKPPGIIAILQAIKSAGALQAELVVQ